MGRNGRKSQEHWVTTREQGFLNMAGLKYELIAIETAFTRLAETQVRQKLPHRDWSPAQTPNASYEAIDSR